MKPNMKSERDIKEIRYQRSEEIEYGKDCFDELLDYSLDEFMV